MYLGRVVTTSKNIKLLDFIEKVGSVDDINEDIPTLIIGKQQAIDKYGKDNVHIIDRKLAPNVYWTYSKMEKRTEFEDDLEKFKESIVKCLEKSIKYYYFSIFTEPLDRIKNFLKFIKGSIKKYIYINNKHIYIYSSKTVIGFSLRDTEYIGIESSKILKMIKSNPSNIIIEDNFLSEDTKRSLKNPNIMIPYLYFLRER